MASAVTVMAESDVSSHQWAVHVKRAAKVVKEIAIDCLKGGGGRDGDLAGFGGHYREIWIVGRRGL
jgi:hypothetical protein